MTKNQLSEALRIAQSTAVLSSVEFNLFDGCALHGFKPITVTMKALAQFIRWHVVYLDGTIDSEELNRIAVYGKRSFSIV